METEDVQENCSDLVYFNSQRGHKKLYHHGYVYRKNRTIQKTTYWACQEKGFRCPGRIIITDGKITKRSKHNHWPDPCEAKVQITTSRMIASAKDDENVGTLEIVKKHLGKVDATYRPYLPSGAAVKRRLQRARKRSQGNGQFAGCNEQSKKRKVKYRWRYSLIFAKKRIFYFWTKYGIHVWFITRVTRRCLSYFSKFPLDE